MKTNYIQTLQEANKVKDAQLSTARESVQAMIGHLHGAKFSGQGSDGSRKDWIATGDVLAWLMSLRSELCE